jgi:outer membrane protein OmpA-like peptidoglycan-associated protein
MNDVVKSSSSKVPLIISIVALVGLIAGMFWMQQNFQKEIALLKDKAAKYDSIEKDIAALKNQIAEKDKEIARWSGLVEQHTKENVRLADENAKLRAELNKPAPVVASTPAPKPVGGEELVEKIVVSALFGFNSAEITPEGDKELQKVATFIGIYDSAVVIEGHTDIQGDPDYNIMLSKRRADAVKERLLALSGDKKPCDIVIVGVGSAKPISKENKQNRRVTVTAIQDCKAYKK